MKKVIYALVLLLVAVSGLVFANREIKKRTAEKPVYRPLTAAEKNAELKNWEASPDGIKFKKWQASPEGKKVLDAAAKLNRDVHAFTNMEAVITSLSLPPGSRLGFGVMARIKGEEYILRFDDGYQQLQSLQVNDKIIIKSHSVMYAPKYAFPIVSGEYAERDGKIIYKHPPRKGGC